MKVNEELIQKIAANARLELTKQEVKEFLPQLQEILKVFDKLKEVKTDKVKPSFQPIDVQDVLREDKIKECLPVEDVFINVKNRKDNYFKGPKAI